MVGPGIMVNIILFTNLKVIFTPLIFGFLLGPKAIAGLLPGCLVSSVQMAISSSNSGGAWDNAKKYYE
jgi:inorganic pyrophosphatase